MASLVCATCRKLIPPGTNAIRCTVASCNTGRMKLRFCSAACWEKHVPTARHRKASYVVEGERGGDADEAAPADAAQEEAPVSDEPQPAQKTGD